ncbi:hypothetical protein M4578_14375 [Salipiger sp. P9]|uniref:hypothetical protein n=1 Tax=Salipiger pentaromativorans TaxID=2943193 RepID=UPI0021583D35|nr:hypothetical protein [Salipiger pentaromativorans]MCR8549021.1 hypothetical protein [Salipiger pentaromativorans]
MQLQTHTAAGWASSAPLPDPLDCETAALLRQVLLPVLETAPDWKTLAKTLARKGYDITFRMGHMVILNAETGAALCTGRMLGAPLQSLSGRLGRPALRLNPDGCSAELDL